MSNYRQLFPKVEKKFHLIDPGRLFMVGVKRSVNPFPSVEYLLRNIHGPPGPSVERIQGTWNACTRINNCGIKEPS